MSIAERQLFRQEALDFRKRHSQWGDVASLEPLSLKVTAWFLVAVVCLLIGFLFVAQYARKETAVGYRRAPRKYSCRGEVLSKRFMSRKERPLRKASRS